MLEIKHTITTEEEKSNDILPLKVNGFDLFENIGNGEIVNPVRLYYAYFGKVPSVKRNWGTDFDAAVFWIEKECEHQIVKTHFTELNVQEKPTPVAKKKLYVLRCQMLISIEEEGSLHVLYDSGSTGYNKIADYFFHQIIKASLRAQELTPQKQTPN